MASDTFDVEVRAVDGTSIELLCTTTGAGGLNDYASTRSFVLCLLTDATPRRGATAPPLHEAVNELGGKHWLKEFHVAHVGKFIVDAWLVSREGIIQDESAWQRQRQELDDALSNDPNFQGDVEAELDKRLPRHRFVVRAKVTDSKWLQGIHVGKRFGTTAYDVWWNDTVGTEDEDGAQDE